MAAGAFTTQGQAGPATTTWNYDAQSGQMIGKAYADNHGPTYTYTPAGRLATRTWARGIVTTYGYDHAGQLASITYSDGTTAPAGYTYDRLGRLATASGGGSARALTYQGNTSLVTSENSTAGPLAGLSVNTGYDALLRRNSLQVARGGTSLVSQSFGFDAASRLASAAQGTASAEYGYWPNSASGLVHTITFKNSGAPVMITTKEYDALDRLTSTASTVTGSATPVSGFAYTYNAANQRVRADLTPDGTHWLYGYDALGQVTSASRRWSDNTPVGGQQYGYAYDQIGNRTSATTNGRQSAYTANALNEYSQRTVPGAVDVIGTAAPQADVSINGQAAERQQGGYFYGSVTADNSQDAMNVAIDVKAVVAQSVANAQAEQQGNLLAPETPEQFSYDLDGNLISDGRWTYSWDAENRLTALEELATVVPFSGKKLTFLYDDMGRRMEKNVFAWQSLSNVYELNSTLRFACNGWDILAELSSETQIIHSYLWDEPTSKPQEEGAGVRDLLLLIDQHSYSYQTYIYVKDPVCGVSTLLNATTGEMAARYEYSAFGELIRVTGGNIAQQNPFRYSVEFADNETGLYNFGYRYYQPRVGRWLSRDPIDEAGGFNLFALLKNDGVNHKDKLGMISFDQVQTLIIQLAAKAKNTPCVCTAQGPLTVSVDLSGSPYGSSVTNNINVKAGGCFLGVVGYVWWDCFTAQREAGGAIGNWQEKGFRFAGNSITDSHSGVNVGIFSSSRIDSTDAAHWNWEALVIYRFCDQCRERIGVASTNQLNYAWGGWNPFNRGWKRPEIIPAGLTK